MSVRNAGTPLCAGGKHNKSETQRRSQQGALTSPCDMRAHGDGENPRRLGELSHVIRGQQPTNFQFPVFVTQYTGGTLGGTTLLFICWKHTLEGSLWLYGPNQNIQSFATSCDKRDDGEMAPSLAPEKQNDRSRARPPSLRGGAGRRS